jgi:hypothetical protein
MPALLWGRGYGNLALARELFLYPKIVKNKTNKIYL